jgi:hypothetical protein
MKERLLPRMVIWTERLTEKFSERKNLAVPIQKVLNFKIIVIFFGACSCNG